MPLPPSDRQLRRLVAQIASAGPEDIEAILEELETPQRARVEHLLAEYLGVPAWVPSDRGRSRQGAREEAVGAPQLAGLSDDIVARLGGDGFAITPAALAAFRECAAAAPAAYAPAPGSTPLRNLMRRLQQGRSA